MNSGRDMTPESARGKSPSAVCNGEKLPESLEMDRAFADNVDRDGKTEDGNSASGDHTMQDNVNGNKSKDQVGAGFAKKDDDAIGYNKRESRNPITGLGLNGDGVGGLKSKRPKAREGNPVTGEGYKPGGNDFSDRTNGDKNGRGSSGRYSSGLW